MSRHIYWVAAVGKDLLDHKGLPVEYYANHVTGGNVPLNTLGLLCLARNWHIHICVFLKNGIWTTRHDNSMEGVEIYLAYIGGLNFIDTVPEDYVVQSDSEIVGQNVLDLLCIGPDLSTNGTPAVGTKETSSSTNTTTPVNVSTNATQEVGTKETSSSTKKTTPVNVSTNATQEVGTKVTSSSTKKTRSSTKSTKGTKHTNKTALK